MRRVIVALLGVFLVLAGHVVQSIETDYDKPEDHFHLMGDDSPFDTPLPKDSPSDTGLVEKLLPRSIDDVSSSSNVVSSQDVDVEEIKGVKTTDSDPLSPVVDTHKMESVDKEKFSSKKEVEPTHTEEPSTKIQESEIEGAVVLAKPPVAESAQTEKDPLNKHSETEVPDAKPILKTAYFDYYEGDRRLHITTEKLCTSCKNMKCYFTYTNVKGFEREPAIVMKNTVICGFANRLRETNVDPETPIAVRIGYDSSDGERHMSAHVLEGEEHYPFSTADDGSQKDVSGDTNTGDIEKTSAKDEALQKDKLQAELEIDGDAQSEKKGDKKEKGTSQGAKDMEKAVNGTTVDEKTRKGTEAKQEDDPQKSLKDEDLTGIGKAKEDEEPGKGKGKEEPGKGKGKEEPGKGKGKEKPGKGKGKEEPGKGKGKEEPGKGKWEEEPGKGKGKKELGKGKWEEEPGKGKGKEDPGKGKGKEDPGKGKGKEEPGKGKGKEEPGKGKGKEEPGKGKGKEEPGKGKWEKEPGKGKGKEEPGKGKWEEEPGKGKWEEEPGKGKGKEEPGKGKWEEEPGKGKGLNPDKGQDEKLAEDERKGGLLSGKDGKPEDTPTTDLEEQNPLDGPAHYDPKDNNDEDEKEEDIWALYPSDPKGPPDHEGPRGPPDHKGSRGPPDHEGLRGPPDHEGPPPGSPEFDEGVPHMSDPMREKRKRHEHDRPLPMVQSECRIRRSVDYNGLEFVVLAAMIVFLGVLLVARVRRRRANRRGVSAHDFDVENPNLIHMSDQIAKDD